jgi:hypothetical protein
VQTHTHMHTHTNARAQICLHSHTYIRTIHTCTPRSRTHAGICTHAHACIPCARTTPTLRAWAPEVAMHKCVLTQVAMYTHNKTAVGFGACKLLRTHGYVYTHTHTHTPRRPLWAWAPASSDPPTVEHRSSRVLAPAVHTHTGWHSVRPRDYRRAVKPSWARVVCTLSAPSAPALAPRRPSRSRLQF